MTIEKPISPSSLPRTERPDAPAYLTRHQSRRSPAPAGPAEQDESVPLYLRQFRDRGHISEPVTYDGNVIGTS